jgi:hypothetical protein
MMSFEHGGGLRDSGQGKDGDDPSKTGPTSSGAFVSTETPDGFNAPEMRKLLQVWFASNKEMVLNHIVQLGGSTCYERANNFVPKYLNLAVLQVQWNTDARAFLEHVRTKLGRPSHKPPICSVLYTNDTPIAGSKSTFANHWVLLIGHGTDTHGRDFLIVFDPDVNATALSQKAWASCEKRDLQKAPDEAVLRHLIFGEGDHLGGLIRYFYA